MHKRGVIGYARGLLHVVRHQHQREMLLQRGHQLFNHQRRDRIQRRGGFIQQQHFRLDGDGARNHQTLLLTARQRQRILPQLIFHFAPQRRRPQRALAGLIQHATIAHALQTQTVNHILIDRLGERIRALEHHADAPPQRRQILVRLHHRVAIEQNLTFDAAAINDVVHAIEAAQQRRFTAAGRPNQRRDAMLWDLQINVIQRLAFAVPQRQLVNGERNSVIGRHV